MENDKNILFATKVVLGICIIWIIRDFFNPIFLAFVTATIFNSWYIKINSKVKNKNFSSLLTLILILSVIILPLVEILNIVTEQIFSSLDHLKLLSLFNSNSGLNYNLAKIIPVSALSKLGFYNSDIYQILTAHIQKYFSSISQSINREAFNFASQGLSFLIKFVVYIIFSLYFLPQKDKIYDNLVGFFELNADTGQRLLNTYENVVKSVIKGNIVTMLVQGIVNTSLLLILGLPYALIWGLLLALFSIIPMGIGLIWWPITIYYFLVGNYIVGTVCALWGIILIPAIDNLVRAKLSNTKDLPIPLIIMLIAILGGIKTFGVIGILYAPLILVLFKSIIDMSQRSVH